MSYACKECGAPATVSDEGAITRTCVHTGTVLALMEATIKIPMSVLEPPSTMERLLKFFTDIGNNIMGAKNHGVR